MYDLSNHPYFEEYVDPKICLTDILLSKLMVILEYVVQYVKYYFRHTIILIRQKISFQTNGCMERYWGLSIKMVKL